MKTKQKSSVLSKLNRKKQLVKDTLGNTNDYWDDLQNGSISQITIDTSIKKKSAQENPLVGLIMGSQSDWKVLENTAQTLEKLNIIYELNIISAHRTPDLLFKYAAEAEGKHLQVLIAGAGGAAHLPGMLAAKTALPVLGVPIPSTLLQGIDSLLSIVQMPSGIPVATFAIGKAGAINAALFAAAILARTYPTIAQSLQNYRIEQTQRVMAAMDPRQS